MSVAALVVRSYRRYARGMPSGSHAGKLMQQTYLRQHQRGRLRRQRPP